MKKKTRAVSDTIPLIPIFNSLWCSDTCGIIDLSQHWFRLTNCWQTAPKHCRLNQCWRIISKVLNHSHIYIYIPLKTLMEVTSTSTTHLKISHLGFQLRFDHLNNACHDMLFIGYVSILRVCVVVTLLHVHDVLFFCVCVCSCACAGELVKACFSQWM